MMIPIPDPKYTAVENAGRKVVRLLAISEPDLGLVLGTSPIVTRKYLVGGSLLSHPAALEQVMLLLRIYSTLVTIVSDEHLANPAAKAPARQWLHSYNKAFDMAPMQKMIEPEGASSVLNYLEGFLAY